MRVLAACAIALGCTVARAQDATPPVEAGWELRALGVAGEDRIQALRETVRRPVTLAFVGQGGVSLSQLRQPLPEGNTLEYRGGAGDPGAGTHDTGMANVILDITSRLGVEMHLVVYQPGEEFQEVAADMAAAAAEADIVAFYQSFWGDDVSYIDEALQGAEGCLLISPYVEYEGRLTSTCPQALSAKPWSEGLPNFITVAPYAYKQPGAILTPSAREGDAEVLNFVAPSWYANSAGGTCPSAAVAAAVAAYVMASAETPLQPAEVVQLMRETVNRDPAALQARLGIDEAQAAALLAQIAALSEPAEDAMRKLDAPGVLDLWAIYERMEAAEAE